MGTLGDILAVSQSSVLLPKVQLQASIRGRCFLSRDVTSARISTDHTYICFLKTRSYTQRHTISAIQQPEKRATWAINASVIPESKVPTSSTLNSASEGVEIEPDTSGGGADIGSTNGGGDSGGGGGGGGGGNNWDNNNKGEGESDKSKDSNKKMAMSMSQKLTLGYAALVGVGGIMGYVKSGSQKSLISGGISAAILYYVYTQLPQNTVMASSIGLGISAALLGVMGTRFKKSGKVFPAGVVSLVSLVMTGGYLHGIMRGMH